MKYSLAFFKIGFMLSVLFISACGGGGGEKNPPPLAVSSAASQVAVSVLSSSVQSLAHSSSVSSINNSLPSSISSVSSSSSLSSSSSSVSSSSSLSLSSSSSSAALAQLRIKGIVTDAPVAHANVQVTVGSKRFDAKANAQGEYEILLEYGEQELHELVLITARGVDGQAGVVLVSLLPSIANLAVQAGEDKVLDKQENFAVNVTNVTTADYALILTQGELPTTDIALQQALSTVAPQEKFSLAALIKIIVDHDGYALPAGFIDTLEFSQNSAAVKAFQNTVNIHQPELLQQYIAAIKADANLLYPSEKSLAGEYIVHNPQRYFADNYFLDLKPNGSGQITYKNFSVGLTWAQIKNKVTVTLAATLQTDRSDIYPTRGSYNISRGQFEITALEFDVFGSDEALKTIEWTESLDTRDYHNVVIDSQVMTTSFNLVNKAHTKTPDLERLVGTWVLSNLQGQPISLEFNADGSGAIKEGGYADDSFRWQNNGTHITLSALNNRAGPRNIWFVNDLSVGYQIVFSNSVQPNAYSSYSGFLLKKQNITLTEADIVGRMAETYNPDKNNPLKIMDYAADGTASALYSGRPSAWKLLGDNRWGTESFYQDGYAVSACVEGRKCTLTNSVQYEVLAEDNDNFYAVYYNKEYWADSGELFLDGSWIVVLQKNYRIKQFNDWFAHPRFHRVNDGKIDYWSFQYHHDIHGKATYTISINDVAGIDVVTPLTPTYNLTAGKLFYTRNGKNLVLELIEAKPRELIVCEYESTGNCQAGTEFSLIFGNPVIDVLAETQGAGSISKFITRLGKPISVVITPDEGNMIQSVEGCDGLLIGNTYTTADIYQPCTLRAVFTETKPLAEVAGVTDPELAQCINALPNTAMQTVTSVNCNDVPAGSLTGLENFKNLQFLSISRTALSGNITVPDLPKLHLLNLSGNTIDAIDFSGSTALVDLELSDNNLSELDVRAFPKLTFLAVGNNHLTELDLSDNPLLMGVNAAYNFLTHIDLHDLPELRYLIVLNNQLTAIDFSKNPKLSSIDIGRNQLGSLDISPLPDLTSLAMSYNAIAAIDLSKSPNLEHFIAIENQLATIDLFNNVNMKYLDASGNQLTDMDFSHTVQLQNLSLNDNKLVTVSGVEYINDKQAKINLERNFFNPATVTYVDGLIANGFTQILY